MEKQPTQAGSLRNFPEHGTMLPSEIARPDSFAEIPTGAVFADAAGSFLPPDGC
jgi:hypothetical protein